MNGKFIALCLSAVLMLSFSAAGCDSEHPMVGSASQSVKKISEIGDEELKEKANALSEACSAYYADAVSGVISAENPHNVTCDTLPSGNDTEAKKKSIANILTVEGAMQYKGLTDLEPLLNSFAGETSERKIYALTDPDKPAGATVSIKPTTPLFRLGYA